MPAVAHFFFVCLFLVHLSYLSGTPEVVKLAVGRVLTQLAQSPLRAGTKTVHYVPGPAFYDYADGQQQQQQQHVQQHHAHPQQAVGSGAGVVTGAGPISIQKIAIPTICAGCVIGRSGSIIRDLRSQSGTNISIADPDPATPDERVVTITSDAHAHTARRSDQRHAPELRWLLQAKAPWMDGQKKRWD